MGRKRVVWVGVIVGGTDSVVEGTGQGSKVRRILKMGCGRGLGCAGKSKSLDLVVVATEGKVVTKITM